MILGFTYLHWKTLEDLAYGLVELEDVDEEELAKMAYLILPDGRTMFHILAYNPPVLRKVLAKTEICGCLAYMDIPIMLDVNMDSALDLLLRKKDLNTIDLLLKYMGKQGIDHHSRAL